MTRRDIAVPDDQLPNDGLRVIDGGRNGPRRSSSGRIPQWAADEYLGYIPEQNQWRAPGDPKLKHRSRKFSKVRTARRRLPRWMAVSLGITLVAGLYLTPGLLNRVLPPAAHSLSADVPPAGVEAAEAPLGAPPAVGESDQYRLQAPPDAEQALMAFDPCRPIHYVISGHSQLPGGATAIQEAVAEISAATGLRFIDDGETLERPSERRPAYQPEEYGERWAPVLIAWSSPEENPDLAGDVAGLGGGSPRKAVKSPWVYVSGQIELDTQQAAEMLLRPEGASITRALVMHELAHVLGLDHVNDPTQLMYGGPNTATTLGDGDRAGLARLGQGACAPAL